MVKKRVSEYELEKHLLKDERKKANSDRLVIGITTGWILMLAQAVSAYIFEGNSIVFRRSLLASFLLMFAYLVVMFLIHHNLLKIRT